MFDADAPSSKRVLEQVRDRATHKRLTALAQNLTKSEQDADDLLEEAILRALDPEDAPWDPAQRPLASHMAYVMRQTWDQRGRKASVQREALADDLDESGVARGREPAADDELERMRSAAVLKVVLDRVLGQIGDKHPRARQIVDLAARGVDQPAEQARSLGCPVEEVYRALKTLKLYAAAARAEHDQAERLRMENLRRTTTKEKSEALP